MEQLCSIDRSESAIILMADGDLCPDSAPAMTSDATRGSVMSRGWMQSWITRAFLCLFVLTSSGCSLLLDLDAGKDCNAHSDCDDNLYCSDLITSTGTGSGCALREDCKSHSDCEGNTYCSSLDDGLANICIPYICGNGVVEPGETCDGDCPTDCWDGTACTTDTLVGDADTCSAVCVSTEIVAGQCENDDGCCPSDCTVETDNDCQSVCGDGFIGPEETCEGDSCPTADSCDDSQACTTDIFSGSAENCNAACSYVEVTACTAGDGCCPPGLS